MTDYRGIDYWSMSDERLREEWRDVSKANFEDDFAGNETERLNFVEDAILQRIGAPDYASGDEACWQDKIREWGEGVRS